MTAASPEKVVVAIDGQEAEARFTTNGLCEVEGAFGGQSLEAVGQAMAAGQAGFSVVRTLFRALLLHSRPEMTPVQAGRLIEGLGMEETARVIQAAFDVWKAGAVGRKLELPELDAQGRLAFEAGGVRYVLAFGFNAMAEIEPTFPGMSMTQIAAELVGGGVSVSRLRALFRAALIDHVETTLFEAGDVIDRIGMATASDAIGKAFVGAFPKVPEGEGDHGDEAGEAEGNRKARRAASSGKANPPRPPRRKAGIGKP